MKHLSTHRAVAAALALLLAACSDGGGPTGSESIVPGAPQNAAATALDAQATVTWAAPATAGTVTGVANGTACTFTVVAVNAVGEGPASAPTAPVTPRTPSAPIDLTTAPRT